MIIGTPFILHITVSNALSHALTHFSFPFIATIQNNSHPTVSPFVETKPASESSVPLTSVIEVEVLEAFLAALLAVGCDLSLLLFLHKV